MTTKATRSPRRRTVIALAVVLAVLAAFIVRLVDIQVVNADDHIAESKERALGAARTLYGQRGAIVDETGQPLAGSILLYDAQLDPSNVRTITRKDAAGESVKVTWEQTSAQIAAITGQTPEEVRAIVEAALANDPKSQYALLAKGLSTEQYRDLADLDIPFLYFEPHPARTYPDGAVAGNLVGFVGVDGDPLAGLEKSEDACLAARDGSETFERGKDGVVIPGTEERDDAVDGGTLQLTINRDLQWFLQQLIAEQAQNMGAQSGAIMVTEVATGKVRAVAEYPTVDPNNVDASAEADRASRAFTQWFEPGSTFKALTASALVDGAGQNASSTEVVPDREEFANGAVVVDAFWHDPTNYTLAGVLVDSSNVGISKFSERIDPQARYDYLRKFGIGEGSAIGFEGELSGLLHPVSDWDNQMLYDTSYGQGVTTTLPELMGAYGAIANNGLRMPLSIVEGCAKPDGTVVAPDAPEPVRVISEDSAKTVQQMLEQVFVQGGVSRDVAIPGYRVAGKTGTGQKVDEGTGRYKDGVYFTTMIGFAPADDPQYLVAVTLDEPTAVRSSAANASAWQKAMTQVLKTYRVMPSTTAPELLPVFG
ncbi:penicillin-binding protein 2 [Microbacterium sp. BWT-B31]|uniref:peptidoglycan D,D-transpeptidase FtsI family protein n=1 Tax=Microbacterium sp. BWT-B31 TaxID=3232072 RepID=UPI0035283339